MHILSLCYNASIYRGKTSLKGLVFLYNSSKKTNNYYKGKSWVSNMNKKIATKNAQNIAYLKQRFCNGDELIIKEFFLGQYHAFLVYMVGLIDVEILTDFLIKPAQRVDKISQPLTRDYLIQKVFFLPQLDVCADWEKIVTEITKGKAVVFVESLKEAMIANVDKFKERSISEPPTSSVLRGPRSGFIENYKVNISCIRKILSTSHLRTKILEVGKITKTQIAVMYIDSIADDKIVQDIVKKIENINIDGVLDSFYIASYLEHHPQSMFKQVGTEEKPDIVCAKMLEGRIAIIVDGSPIVLTVPFLFIEDLQSSGDYYDQHSRARFLRWLRVASLLITILFPGMYVAVQMYHYKTMPLKFLITIMNSTQGLPLTPFLEIVFILLLFEVLYEASLRMPTYLGLALSVVGALILGDTAVKAGLVSPPAVMIVAMSGITLYTIPNQSGQLSILRWVFTFAGGCFGFYGIILLSFFLILYLNDFDGYGSPYLAPISPNIKEDKKDALSKIDIVHMRTRPKSVVNHNPIRQRKGGRKS